MKQSKLVEQIYKACIDGDQKKLSQLKKHEFEKIIKHKSKNKQFTAKWAVVQI